jgi:hypothetical protein
VSERESRALEHHGARVLTNDLACLGTYMVGTGLVLSFTPPSSKLPDAYHPPAIIVVLPEISQSTQPPAGDRVCMRMLSLGETRAALTSVDDRAVCVRT